MIKGTKVTIRPLGYPGQVWSGEVLRKTPNGFSVRYEAWGVTNRATFSARELESAA